MQCMYSSYVYHNLSMYEYIFANIESFEKIVAGAFSICRLGSLNHKGSTSLQVNSSSFTLDKYCM